MASLSDPLYDCLYRTVDHDSGKTHIVNTEGYHFGVYSEKDEKIIFFEPSGQSKQIIFKIKDIKEVLKCEKDTLELTAIGGQGVFKACFRGFTDEDPRSKTYTIIPDRHGGTFQDIELILNLNPDLKKSFWTDDLTGNRYVDLKAFNGKGCTLIPDANVDFRKFLEIESKRIWKEALNVKKTDAEDQMNRLAADNKRNLFLEWIQKPSEITEPIPDMITADNFLRTIGATAAELEDHEDEYLSEIMKALLLAVIERQHHPSVVDLALCLIGPQGTGKTTFCRILGREWYRSTSEDVHNVKQFMESANGGVIVEFREGLQVLNPETLKDFLDSDVLQYRKPYDKMERSYPVRFVTIITTNDDQPLVDQTGARRIAPIYMQGDVDGSIRPLEIDPETIQRIWHKAYEDYCEGDRWRNHWDAIKDYASILQESATVSPPYYERVMAALENYPEGSHISNRELEEVLSKDMNDSTINVVKKYIKKSPSAYGLKRATKTFRDPVYGPSRGYVKE